MSAPVGVIGGGGFGRALATAVLAQGGEVVVWSRRGADGASGASPDEATRDAGALTRCELIFVAVPSMHVPTIAPELAPALDGSHLLVHVSRGLVGDELETVSEVLRRETAARRVGCLAGPLNPAVLAEGTPGGGIVGSRFPEVAGAVRDAIGGATLRLYDTDDVIGVELASAMVGLLALAAGFGLEASVSPAALAIMLNRGLAEAARVGERIGARVETFHGMAGAGDLFAAVAGDERAEVRLGRAMARTESREELEQAASRAGAYIEGLSIARRVSEHAARLGLETPIATVMADVFEGRIPAIEGMAQLMNRGS